MQTAGAQSIDTSIVARIDGRHRRKVRSREACLAACREMMVAGVFQPLASNVASRAGVSFRSGFQHFRDLEALHLAAIDDEVTQKAIRVLVYGDRWSIDSRDVKDRIVLAVVLGRV